MGLLASSQTPKWDQPPTEYFNSKKEPASQVLKDSTIFTIKLLTLTLSFIILTSNARV